MTTITLEQIKNVRIASPCPMQWDDLDGDGNIRFCRQCSLHVHNFSEMAQEEVAAVLEQKRAGKRVCAGWYRRADGTMIMRDCPVGLRLVRQKMRRALMRVAAALGLLAFGSLALAKGERAVGRVRTYQPFASLCEWLAPTAAPPPQAFLAGDIAWTPPVLNAPPPVQSNNDEE